MGKDQKPSRVMRLLIRGVLGPKEGRRGSAGPTSKQMWSEFDKGKRDGGR